MVEVVGVIPARLGSTRLPRKMLLNETGKPLVQHTYEQAAKCRLLDDLVIATDSVEIVSQLDGFPVVLTGEHPTGTDRVAEAVAQRWQDEPEIVVNIQGDEPEIDPAHLDLLIAALEANPHSDVATLATHCDVNQMQHPSIVKVILDDRQHAQRFTREPCATRLRHIGVYAYRASALRRFASAPRPIEETESSLEQIRALFLGMRMLVAYVDHASRGIDTPDDYQQFCERHRAWKASA